MGADCVGDSVGPRPEESGASGGRRGHGRSRRAPYLALAFGVVCIGFSAIFVRLSAVPGPVSAFYRLVVATLVLVPWWLTTTARRLPQRDVFLIVGGGVCFGLDLVLWNSAVMLTSAATSTVLANNAPILVALAAVFLLGERLPASYWVGLLIALGGTMLLVGAHVSPGGRLNTGDVLVLVANVFYAAYLLITQEARARIDTLALTALSAASGGALLLAVNLVAGTPLAGFGGGTWAALLGLGLVTHVGGWMSINYALGHLRASLVSASLLGQAVVTALLAIPLLGERPGGHEIVGGALVLGGIYVVNRRGERTAAATSRRDHG